MSSRLCHHEPPVNISQTPLLESANECERPGCVGLACMHVHSVSPSPRCRSLAQCPTAVVTKHIVPMRPHQYESGIECGNTVLKCRFTCAHDTDLLPLTAFPTCTH
eukprot:scaffold24572_cov21-Tisochrysis_lutea.AAC.5